MTSSLEFRIQSVQKRIAEACLRSSRDPSSVTLVAVTKTAGRREIDLAYQAGIRDFGENRVQAAVEKLSGPWPQDARTHMIGSLQSNKAAAAIELFDVIHSVDRPSLIQELQRQASRRNQKADILLQVNVSGETQKAGCAPENTLPLATTIASAAGLNLLGLMTIAPLVETAEQARLVFAGLRDLRDQLRQTANIGELPILSMGMTNDFEVAIEEGATHVRVGRAIFEG